jgi:hypothetical protein
MGLKKSIDGARGITFVTLSGKRGAFEKKGKDERGETIVLESFDRLDGRVTKVDVSPTNFEGRDGYELKVRLDDGESVVQFGVPLGTFFSAKVVGLLNAADLSKPILFGVGRVEKGDRFGDTIADKEFPWVSARQGDVKLAPVYKDGAGELPSPKEVRINGQVHKDMQEINAIVAGVVAEVQSRVHELNGPAPADAADEDINPAEAAAAAGQRPRG